jgi:hypothetical protein
MYPVGKVELVHPNGRINYQDQKTKADGSHINSEKALTASAAVRSAAVKLEEVLYFISFSKRVRIFVFLFSLICALNHIVLLLDKR